MTDNNDVNPINSILEHIPTNSSTNNNLEDNHIDRNPIPASLENTALPRIKNHIIGNGSHQLNDGDIV